MQEEGDDTSFDLGLLANSLDEVNAFQVLVKHGMEHLDNKRRQPPLADLLYCFAKVPHTCLKKYLLDKCVVGLRNQERMPRKAALQEMYTRTEKMLVNIKETHMRHMELHKAIQRCAP